MARAFAKAIERVRAQVSIYALANALASGGSKAALRMLTKAMLADALVSCGAITRDSVMRGGRLGTGMLKKASRA